MSNLSSNSPPNPTAHQAIIIPFIKRSHTKEQYHPCIFCGKTMKIQKFKGKTVCITCLRQIPAIFSFG